MHVGRIINPVVDATRSGRVLDPHDSFTVVDTNHQI